MTDLNLDLLKLDARDLMQLLRSAYYDNTGVTLRIGSDEFAFSSVISYVWSVLVSQINDAAKQRYIDTATGTFLDAIAATYGINERPQGNAASCMVRLTSPTEMGTVRYTIPAGAVTITDVNGQYFFTNAYPMRMQLFGTGVFVATEAGTKSNGVPVGVLSEVMTGTQYAGAATNLDMSGGGADDLSDDEAFREWLKVQIQTFSGAGTYLAYEAKARQCDPRIVDVHVIQQGEDGYEKGKVQIIVLPSLDDAESWDTIVEIVQNTCSDPAFRPVGDFVVTVAAQEQHETLSQIMHVTYPERFRNLTYERNHRIIAEYNAYLGQGIGRPFSFAELAERLTAKDSDGVYALDVRFTGDDEHFEPSPIYPVTGCYLQMTIDNITTHYVEADA